MDAISKDILHNLLGDLIFSNILWLLVIGLLIGGCLIVLFFTPFLAAILFWFMPGLTGTIQKLYKRTNSFLPKYKRTIILLFIFATITTWAITGALPDIRLVYSIKRDNTYTIRCKGDLIAEKKIIKCNETTYTLAYINPEVLKKLSNQIQTNFQITYFKGGGPSFEQPIIKEFKVLPREANAQTNSFPQAHQNNATMFLSGWWINDKTKYLEAINSNKKRLSIILLGVTIIFGSIFALIIKNAYKEAKIKGILKRLPDVLFIAAVVFVGMSPIFSELSSLLVNNTSALENYISQKRCDVVSITENPPVLTMQLLPNAYIIACKAGEKYRIPKQSPLGKICKNYCPLIKGKKILLLTTPYGEIVDLKVGEGE